MYVLTVRRKVVHDTSCATENEHAGQGHFPGHPFHYYPAQQAGRNLDKRDQREVQILVAGNVRRTYV